MRLVLVCFVIAGCTSAWHQAAHKQTQEIGVVLQHASYSNKVQYAIADLFPVVAESPFVITILSVKSSRAIPVYDEKGAETERSSLMKVRYAISLFGKEDRYFEARSISTYSSYQQSTNKRNAIARNETEKMYRDVSLQIKQRLIVLLSQHLQADHKSVQLNQVLQK